MQDSLKQVKPTEFEDIVALVALYRPGPMRFIPDYARGKRNPDSVRYLDDRLRAITEPTYGIAIYQEQLMKIARDIAGFPGPRADTLRYAIGKKKRDMMADAQGRLPLGLQAAAARPQRRRQPALGADGGGGRLLLQQVARRQLRAHRLPDGLPARQLPGRVHGGADLERDVHQGQGAVLRVALRGDGHRACCRPTSISPATTSLWSRATSASASTPSRTSATRPSRRSSRLARTASSHRSGTSARASTARTVNKKAIESLVRCGAFDSTGATRKGMLEVLAQAQGVGPEGAGGCALGSGLDLRPGRRRGPTARSRSRPTTRRSRRPSSKGSSCWPAKRTPLASSFRATRWRTSAT